MAKESTTKETVAQKPTEMHGAVATPAKKERHESVYSARELADNARTLFGTRPECVIAALKAADKEAYTVGEARETVERFLKKEVR